MGFANSVIGGAAALIRAAIKSPNYVTGTSGWSVNKDGSAEFNSLTVRGTFAGTDYLIGPDGAYFYKGTPAAGNLAFAIPAAGVTQDGFGNAIPNLGVALPSAISFATGVGGAFATAMSVAGIQFYNAATQAGPYTLQGQILSGSSSVELQFTTVTINGQLSLTIPLTVSGTSANAGLTNGTINGTSGAASAGTAHTHGAGSYAVTNGQHNHGPGSYGAS